MMDKCGVYRNPPLFDLRYKWRLAREVMAGHSRGQPDCEMRIHHS
jgi:hypothetical protein